MITNSIVQIGKNFLLISTISVLVLGTVLGMPNLIESADAEKGQGVPASKYGSATKGTVCGDKLCSEVRAEEAKKQNKEKEEVKETTPQQKSTENKKEMVPSTSNDMNMSKVEDKNKTSSKTLITNPSKFPTAKMISTVTSSGNSHSILFQTCATKEVNMRAPEVIVSSDSEVKSIKLNKIILKETCAKTVSSIIAVDPSSINLKVIDKTKLNKMIEKSEKKITEIEDKIASINEQLQIKFNALTDSSTLDPDQVKETNEMISELSELRKERSQLKADYYELIYTIKPN